MDYFTVIGDTFKEEFSNLEKVLQRCRETNILLSHEKCFTMIIEGIVLGHNVSSTGIKVDLAKIEVIVNIFPPNHQKGVRILLVHAGYYRSFIESFTNIAPPLFKLLTK